MSRSASFAGVILAAGESSRMGTDKALLPWPPPAEGQPPSTETFLSAAIRSLSPSSDFVLVVAGKNESSVAPTVYAAGALMALNPNPARGQFSSLQIGLQEVLNRGRDAAIITLVDRPPAAAATVQSLRAAFEAVPLSVWAVVPELGGKHGHPYVIGRELIEEFLEAPASANARDIEHRYQDRIYYLPVDDPHVVLNIDRPEDYSALTK